jgi:hypothetical protein
MPFIFKRLALFISIAAAFAADKEQPLFKVPPVTAFAHQQSSDKVTIGADPYNTGDKVKAAFGKVDPYKEGVLPVLVVIQNDGGETIRLDSLKVEYVGPGGTREMATPAKDVRYLYGLHRPGAVSGPGGRVKVTKAKNPLEAWEIEGRAFAAQMLPAGQTASGFFYFHTALMGGATIYLSGLSVAKTGKELLYFELPLE